MEELKRLFEEYKAGLLAVATADTVAGRLTAWKATLAKRNELEREATRLFKAAVAKKARAAAAAEKKAKTKAAKEKR